VKATLVALAVATLTAGMAGCAVTPADPSSQVVQPVDQPSSEPYRSFYYSYPNPISYPGDASHFRNYDRRGW
jgi:hypothetical protein